MPHHVFIHVPAFGEQITRTTFHATHALRDYLHFKGMATGINSMSFPDIAELRAMVTTIWFDTMPQSDYLLFVDADMGSPPEHVADMILFNEPLIGTIYRQRKEPVSWAGSGNGAPETQRRGSFILVEGVGFGCTLIKREVIATMLQHMPELADYRIALHPAGDTLRGAGANRLIRAFEKLDVPDRGLISEDLSFCIRWARCGGQTWAHVGSHISHVGPYDFAGCYIQHVEQLAAQARQEAAQQAALPIPAVQPPQLIPLSVKPLPLEISTGVLPNGRDGAPAMSDPLPAGLQESQLMAAE
jgi:hypothetical protein